LSRQSERDFLKLLRVIWVDWIGTIDFNHRTSSFIKSRVFMIASRSKIRRVKPSVFMKDSKLKLLIFSAFSVIIAFLQIPQYKVNRMKIICAEYLSISDNFADEQFHAVEKFIKIVILDFKQV
tara:strand:- start:426 stop:794 length:369 start_codon:yes stop_codon:yes gene_type:complete